ncbi:MAG: AAA family ATPase [Minicystis sp.]
MLLRNLHLRHLKRLSALELDFKNPDGSPRKWTALIGRNGTAKTTILQAIALAAAGSFRADKLVDDIRESLPDKRVPGAEAWIEAEFTFGPVGLRAAGAHPTLAADLRPRLRDPGHRLLLNSVLNVRAKASLEGAAGYTDERGEALDSNGDPLVEAREENQALWFVAGYGVDRFLPQVKLVSEPPPRPSIDRLRPIFQRWDLLGPNWESVLGEGLWQKYAALLKKVLFRTEELVPGIVDLELRGRRSQHPNDLMTSHRFVQRVGDNELKLPATWLSHGYQSVLAWVSDLVGQITLEAGAVLPPEKMEGLVLIDEVDLYLHPKWQVGLVQALRDTFPEMQFVVTTHSPILLTAFRREEVVVLDFNEHGDVVQSDTPKDPRLMTATELYEWFFGIDRLYPSELGQKLDAYNTIAANPFRTEDEDAIAAKLGEDLRREGITPGVPLSPRRRATGT